MNNPIRLRKYSKDTDDESIKQTCRWQGCMGEGLHRAPKSRQKLQEYQWFCMDHIRQFNKSWNYYKDMDEVQVEEDKRHDTVWNRPTWKLGSNGNTDEAMRAAFYNSANGYADPFGVFEEDGPANQGPHKEAHQGSTSSENTSTVYGSPEQRRALKIFDIDPPLTKASIKARYKELVKRHHPDANGGDPNSEKKIRQINNAYDTLLSLINA